MESGMRTICPHESKVSKFQVQQIPEENISGNNIQNVVSITAKMCLKRKAYNNSWSDKDFS